MPSPVCSIALLLACLDWKSDSFSYRTTSVRFQSCNTTLIASDLGFLASTKFIIFLEFGRPARCPAGFFDVATLFEQTFLKTHAAFSYRGRGGNDELFTHDVAGSVALVFAVTNLRNTRYYLAMH